MVFQDDSNTKLFNEPLNERRQPDTESTWIHRAVNYHRLSLHTGAGRCGPNATVCEKYIGLVATGPRKILASSEGVGMCRVLEVSEQFDLPEREKKNGLEKDKKKHRLQLKPNQNENRKGDRISQLIEESIQPNDKG
jgi:hypothetical protein